MHPLWKMLDKLPLKSVFPEITQSTSTHFEINTFLFFSLLFMKKQKLTIFQFEIVKHSEITVYTLKEKKNKA